MPFALDDPDLQAKNQKLIQSLDQMQRLAQQAPEQPQAPILGQSAQIPDAQQAASLPKMSGQTSPAEPAATSSPQTGTPGVGDDAGPPNPTPQETKEMQDAVSKAKDAAAGMNPQSSVGSTLKSILTYALPMALTASKGMGILPGAVAGLSAQNKADVTSNEQAIQRVKEANEARSNILKAQQAAANQRIELEKIGQQNAIQQGELGVKQAGIGSENAQRQAAAQKDIAEAENAGGFVGLLRDITGIGRGSPVMPTAQVQTTTPPKFGVGAKKSTASGNVHQPLPGETYAQYKKRVSQ